MAPSPTIARALGFTKSPSMEERTFVQNNVIVAGPSQCEMRSYHASGRSPKEEYLASRMAAKALMGEFRL
jgi:hypothetical protein